LDDGAVLPRFRFIDAPQPEQQFALGEGQHEHYTLRIDGIQYITCGDEAIPGESEG